MKANKAREVRAIQVAIACSLVGAAVKLTAGIATGSMSMISSAADSVGDLFVSVLNLFIVHVAARGPDEDHNFGHGKIEGLGAMFEGGFIFAAAVFIIYESAHKILTHDASHDSTIGILVMVPVLAMTLGTVWFLRKVAKETGSLVVKADAAHYTSDVYVNVGVLVALVLVKLTGIPVIRSGHLDRDRPEHVPRELPDRARGRRGGHGREPRRRGGGEAARSARSDDDLRIVPRSANAHRPAAPRSSTSTSWWPPETTTRAVHEIFLGLQRAIRTVTGETTRVLMHTDPSDTPSVLAQRADAERPGTP